jgi:hypothetical protein
MCSLSQRELRNNDCLFCKVQGQVAIVYQKGTNAINALLGFPKAHPYVGRVLGTLVLKKGDHPIGVLV